MASLDNLLGLLKTNEQNPGKRCPSCQDKEGNLFVLPTRLSIAGYLSHNDIPPLPNFVQKIVKDIPLAHSKYCLQTLRQGYLYVLEHRNTGKKWRVFTSSPEGCLIEHKNVENVSNIPPTYTCNIAFDGADASYISFKESENIIKIYFIFTPNKISARRLDQYEDQDLYLLYGITPDEIRNGVKSILPDEFSPNILEFSTAEKLAIQEKFLNNTPFWSNQSGERYQAYQKKQNVEFVYSKRTNFNDASIGKNFYRYLSIYKKLKKRQGAAIVVNDPIGITQSLNNRRNQALQQNIKPWMETKDNEGIPNEHRLLIYRQLYGLKDSFRQMRIKQMINEQNRYYDSLRIYGSDPELSDEMKEIFLRNLDKDQERYEKNIDNIYTQEASEDEFEEKYWNRLSQEKLDTFKKNFDEKSQFAEQKAENHSQDYIKWLKSKHLLRALDFYDSNEKLDGIQFTLQVSACICGASGSPSVRKQFDKWWSASKITRENLCWRAYSFNITSIIDTINEYLDLQEKIIITDDPITNTDHLSTVDTAVDLLNKITDHINQTGPIIDDLATRGLPIALLSISFADLVRYFLKVTSTQAEQRVLNFFGNMILSRINKEARKLYGLRINICGKSFTADPAKGASKITRKAKEHFQNADLVNTRIAMIVFGFSAYDTIRKITQGKWKNWRERAELVASGMTTVASVFQIGTSVVEYCIGNNPKSMTAITTRNAFGRIFLWGATLSAMAGGMSVCFDIMDGNAALDKNNGVIAIAYYARAMATFALSISQFLAALGSLVPWLERIVNESIKRTIWVAMAEWGLFLGRIALQRGVAIVIGVVSFFATLFTIVVCVVMIIFDDNALQKWLDRCCFSKDPKRDQFDDLTEELNEFYQAVQGTF
ncbi:T6SS effector BTH_I2691 family protein [Gilliamella sp. BG2]|uniref:T6SS effector BTH_I2691 family protein n=1 Tax=Gilliamella sp. BG2 TaxID=3351509 RepID=UPI003985F928